MSPLHTHALTFDSDPYSVTNFVDRMHGECSPLQWLRELVVNSVEAIAETGRGGLILVHSVEQNMDGIGTVRKLAVTDTGEGIAPDSLYSSFQVAMTSRGRGNYGIGAKIAALPMNPAGMIYRSKVEDGIPAELMWHKTGTYGFYAAKDWPDENGDIGYVTEPSCEKSALSLITDKGHGTQVVLCGARHEDDTCKTLSPSTAKSTGNLHWAIRQLNFKFWRIPSNIEIRVENAKVNRGNSEPKDYIVRGGEGGMKRFAAHQGVIDLEANPFRVRWYLLKEDVVKRNSQNGWRDGRIIGTLYREKTGVIEVYAMRRTQRAANLMNDFGIYTGAERVVLLVEPTGYVQERMVPTTARNDLRVGDEGNITSLYKEIGQEFAVLMSDRAPVLADYVKKQLDGLRSISDQQTLKEVIAKAIELYQIKDYRRLAKGAVKTSDMMNDLQSDKEGRQRENSEIDPNPPEPDPSPPEPDPDPLVSPEPPLKTRPRQILNSDGSGKAQQVPPKIEPKKFTWDRLDSYEVTDYENNAQLLVTVNTEGETFNRLLALYKSKPDFREHPDVVEKVVKTKCEASLQLSIFTLEQEFRMRSARLGIGFEKFFERNRGRVCLDAMASKEVDVTIVREIKNLIARKKSQSAAEARVTEVASV